ncbi:MAG: PAS domain-containing protein [Alphaproteobacteria bacterium]|nr:MAG: PAS domain-containing protein [Alphaproteobacteria bacterium]
MIISRLTETDTSSSIIEASSTLSLYSSRTSGSKSGGRLADSQDQLVGYWHEIQGSHLIPAKRDIDMTRLAPLLPHIVLFSVERDPIDFVYKIIGAEVLRNISANFTGGRMSEIAGKGRSSRAFTTLSEIAETRYPRELQVPYVGPNGGHKFLRAIALPFGDDHATVDRLMLTMDFFIPGE